MEAVRDHRTMTVAIVFSCALNGMHAPFVRVEVHLANGLPAFNLVGLPDPEVKESRERVRGLAAQVMHLVERMKQGAQV